MPGHYSYDVNITRGTSESTAEETVITLSSGMLTKISIGFPAGAGGLAHVQILENRHIIFPSNPDNSYAWDNYVFIIDCLIPITKDNLSFIIKAWNVDNIYDHTVSVAFNVIASDDNLPNFLNALKRMVFG